MEPNSFSTELNRGDARADRQPLVPATEPVTCVATSLLADPERFVNAARAAEPPLRKYLCRGAHCANADDIVQTTWLVAWEHRDQFSGRGSPTGWFFRICQSVARQTSESERIYSASPIIEVPNADRVSESGEHARVALDDARLSLIERLSERRREILIARYQDELSIAEIATRFRCRAGTVKATIYQAANWLRRADSEATDQ